MVAKLLMMLLLLAAGSAALVLDRPNGPTTDTASLVVKNQFVRLL
jgi:hypothetical protein